MQIRTINVIEIPDKSTMAVQRLVSFQNDNKGESDAKKLFRDLILEECPDAEDGEILESIERGCFDRAGFCYYILLARSTG